MLVLWFRETDQGQRLVSLPPSLCVCVCMCVCVKHMDKHRQIMEPLDSVVGK